jgi:drug/metabolite transporter (DMT)-like permease
VSWSTAGVLQAQLHSSIPTQLAFRSVFAFFALAGMTLAIRWRRGVAEVSFRLSPAALQVVVLTAITNGTFIVALNETSVANVLLFLATGPIVAAILGARFLGQRLVARTLAAGAVALAGVVVMVGSPSGGALTGDAFAAIAMVAFAVIIVICAKHPEVSMLPAICIAQVIVFAVTIPFASPGELNLGELGWLFLLGAGQLALGQAFFAAAARSATVSEVATISLLEIVLGPLWVWTAGYQSPETATFIGGALVVIGVLIQLGGDSPPVPEQAG